MGIRLRQGRAAVSLFGVFAVLIGAASSLLGTCGPFTDTAADAFCPFVLELFTLGITTGTTATTYDPSAGVSRLAMAAFLSRTVDAALKRGSKRAALDQFWSRLRSGPRPSARRRSGSGPTERTSGSPTRPTGPSRENPGQRHEGPRHLDGRHQCARPSLWGREGNRQQFRQPRQALLHRPAPASREQSSTVATNLGNNAKGIAFDGTHVWTANNFSVSIVTPGDTIPWTVTTVTTGFGNMFGPIFDGTNIWVRTPTSAPC